MNQQKSQGGDQAAPSTKDGQSADEARFRRRREAARRGKDANDYEPKEARAGDPEREGARGDQKE